MTMMSRRIASVVLIAILTAPAWAGAIITRPANPGKLKHYYDRCEKIEADIAALPADTTRTIVLLGDSITEAHPAKELAGMRVVNEGIGGDQIDIPTSSAGVRGRLQLVEKARPAHVFLMIGINDLWWSGKGLKTAKEQYAGLIKPLVAAVPDAKIHLQSVLPSGKDKAKLVPQVMELNQHIQELAKENNLDYLDLYPLMKDDKNELRSDLTKDGIHLLPEGYKIWIGALEERLQAPGEPKK